VTMMTARRRRGTQSTVVVICVAPYVG